MVPSYRGADTLADLLERLDTTLTAVPIDYEVVVVNDASPDNTWERLEELSSQHSELVAIDLLGNRGQAFATMCGMSHARGRLVATMDDDLEQPPEELPKLLAALAENPRWDAAVGNWKRDQGIFRTLGSWVHAIVDRISHGTPLNFRHTSFRVMRRPLVDAILSHQTRTPILSPLIRQLSSQIHNVEVEHHPRRRGISTIGIRESASRVATNLIHGSTLPLKLLSRLGFFVALGSTVGATVVFVRWLLGVQTPPGWASSFLATMFFGGLLLLGIGLLGEYMAVIVKEVRRPPRWAVRQIIGPVNGSAGGSSEDS